MVRPDRNPIFILTDEAKEKIAKELESLAQSVRAGDVSGIVFFSYWPDEDDGKGESKSMVSGSVDTDLLRIDIKKIMQHVRECEEALGGGLKH